VCTFSWFREDGRKEEKGREDGRKEEKGREERMHMFPIVSYRFQLFFKRI
tara:strand:+ start:111 stop:260 length:150 start_codon:yes stop_codon:yes gene_type:complete